MVTCDWCGKQISGEAGKGWGFALECHPFHSLKLGGAHPGKPQMRALALHAHAEPCLNEMGWAIDRLLREREPLETDGPQDVETDPPRTDGRPNLRVVGGEAEQESPAARLRREAQRWRDMPPADRERWLLQHLAFDSLTIGELHKRMYQGVPGCRVYESSVRTLAARMLKAGQLEREGEPWRGRVRYRYRVRKALDGPIAELDETFHTEQEKG